MSPNTKCDECGTELDASAAEGLCPRCLMGMGVRLAGGDAGPPLDQRSTETASAVSGSNKIRYFGDYELLEEIGRGGMGVVYRARQVSLNRTVAIKMLLFGEFASEEFVRRFQMEAEAAASLQHPNIVAIHEVGQHAGQHYYSMDYIDGQNLSERKAQGSVAPEQATAWLKTAAEAIHYAHQRGILHRDIKPANILIDLKGQPHITDFGLARFLQQSSGATQTQAVMGTPGFMAPEQAAGRPRQLTTGADVYGLGAVLYFLFTGKAPFAGDTPAETLRQVLEFDPEPPRRLNKAIDQDLEHICLKALEKDPQRRYGSAEALAEELGRWQRHEPVLAAHPGAWYLLQKFVRRHRAGLAVAVAIFLLLIAGTAASLSQAWRAKRAEKLALTQSRKSEEVARFLKEMLAGVGPSVALGRDTKMLREILDKTADRIGRDLKGEPEVIADLRSTLGEIYHELGEDPKAEAMFREALRLQQSLGKKPATDLAATLRGLGATLQERDDFAGAEALYRQALELQTNSRARLEAQALTMEHLGSVLKKRGKLPEAESQLRQAFALVEAAPEPDENQGSSILHSLALVRKERGDFVEAEKLLQQAVELSKKSFPQGHPDIAFALVDLGGVLREENRLAKAEPLLNEALHMWENLHGSDHQSIAAALGQLAMVYVQRGELEKAEAACRKSLAMFQKTLGETHSLVATAINNLALILREQGKLADAEQGFRDALEARKRIVGEEHPDVAVGMNNLGGVLRQRGSLDEAEAMHLAALAMNRKLLQPDHPDIALTLCDLAYVRGGRGDLAGAEFYLRQALLINEKLPDDHPYLDINRRELIELLLTRGDLIAAETLLRKSESVHRRGGDPLNLEGSIQRLAENLRRQGRYSEAESCARELIGLRETRAGLSSRTTLNASLALARILSEWSWSERANTVHTADLEHATEAQRLLRAGLAELAGKADTPSNRLAGLRGQLGTAMLVCAANDAARSAQDRLSAVEESEKLLLESWAALPPSGNASARDRRDTIDRMIFLYGLWDNLLPNAAKIDEVSRWQHRLAELDKPAGP